MVIHEQQRPAHDQQLGPAILCKLLNNPTSFSVYYFTKENKF